VHDTRRNSEGGGVDRTRVLRNAPFPAWLHDARFRAFPDPPSIGHTLAEHRAFIQFHVWQDEQFENDLVQVRSRRGEIEAELFRERLGGAPISSPYLIEQADALYDAATNVLGVYHTGNEWLSVFDREYPRLVHILGPLIQAHPAILAPLVGRGARLRGGANYEAIAALSGCYHTERQRLLNMGADVASSADSVLLRYIEARVSALQSYLPQNNNQPGAADANAQDGAPVDNDAESSRLFARFTQAKLSRMARARAEVFLIHRRCGLVQRAPAGTRTLSRLYREYLTKIGIHPPSDDRWLDVWQDEFDAAFEPSSGYLAHLIRDNPQLLDPHAVVRDGTVIDDARIMSFSSIRRMIVRVRRQLSAGDDVLLLRYLQNRSRAMLEAPLRRV
jgi:hypothetical protein